MIVLGIDTAIRCTGYGVIEAASVSSASILDCGVIKNKASMPHSECLRRLGGGIKELIDKFSPEAISIESAFLNRNIKTAMILSLARGTVIFCAAEAGIPIFEYSPKSAKKAVTGMGQASKEQVASIIASMLNINAGEIPLDSTDALSLALCYAQTAMRPALKSIMPKPL